MVLEARSFRCEAREHEAAILADPQRTREAERLLVEIGGTAFRHRHGRQPSIGVEAPAVVAAGEPRRAAPALVDHLGAAMGAAVEQHVYLAVAMTHHDHRLATK